MTHSNKQLVGFGLVVLFLGLIALLMTEIRATLMGVAANDMYTNTWSPDCDADGTPDADEIYPCGDPAPPDCDGDGIPDDDETYPCGDPAPSDCDGDGIPDDEETYPCGDPAPSDCDGDGTPDSDEIYPCGDPAPSDCDGDGIPDDDETYPCGDPAPSDCDGDGTPDSDEIYPCGDPAPSDCDGDGTPDAMDEDSCDPEDPEDPEDTPADCDGDGTPDAMDEDSCEPPVILPSSPLVSPPPSPTTPTPFGPSPSISPFTSPTTPATPAHPAAPSLSPFVTPTTSPSDDGGLFPALSEPSGEDAAGPDFTMPTDFYTPLLDEIESWFDAAFPIDLDTVNQDLDIEELHYEEVIEEDGELFYPVAGDEWTFSEAAENVLEWDLYSEEVEDIFSLGADAEGDDMKEAAPSLEAIVEKVVEDIVEGNWMDLARGVLGFSE